MFKTYYTAKPLLSIGSLFNAVFSERSDGKTFDIKARSMERYEETGKATLYVRRYKTELTKNTYDCFMDELLRVFPQYDEKYDFSSSKRGIMIKKKDEKEFNDFVIYFMPLSISGKAKSTIDVYKIGEIDFDEYVPLDYRYLQEEMNILLELWNSIDRERYEVPLIILGNKVDLFNPFLTFFNLSFDLQKRGIRTYRSGALSIEIYANDEHRHARKNSQFMKLIEGTQYEKYMFGDVLNLPVMRIREIPLEAEIWFGFKTVNGSGTIWIDGDDVYVSNKINKSQDFIVDKIYDINNKQLTVKSTAVNKMLKMLYREGHIYFENKLAYNKFEPIQRGIC